MHTSNRNNFSHTSFLLPFVIQKSIFTTEIFSSNKNKIEMVKKIIALFSLTVTVLLSFQFSFAQTNKQTCIAGALKVYLDCPYCDEDFMRTEINCVNFVRDPVQADVHLLITKEYTASGGSNYTLYYLGQQIFQNENDTLYFTANSTNTSDETRKGLTQIISIGLMRYVAHTTMASKITITSPQEDTATVTQKDTVDHWRSWVFSIGGNGNWNGEKQSTSGSYNGNISADKVTAKMKLNTYISMNYDKSIYKLDDTTEFINESNSKYAGASYVKSLNKHWSTGLIADYSASTYENLKWALSTGPALEFDVFPYSQSNRKLWTFYYEIQYQTGEYNDTTIFNKLKESVVQQKLRSSIRFKQKWGSANFTVSGSAYLHDFTKNRMNVSGSASIRLFEGLSLDFYGSFSIIHDQISLPKSGASQEEILLQIKQLQTNYRYYGSVGLSYQFGSIYNNIVNPRFSHNSFNF